MAVLWYLAVDVREAKQIWFNGSSPQKRHGRCIQSAQGPDNSCQPAIWWGALPGGQGFAQTLKMTIEARPQLQNPRFYCCARARLSRRLARVLTPSFSTRHSRSPSPPQCNCLIDGCVGITQIPAQAHPISSPSRHICTWYACTRFTSRGTWANDATLPRNHRELPGALHLVSRTWGGDVFRQRKSSRLNSLPLRPRGATAWPSLPGSSNGPTADPLRLRHVLGSLCHRDFPIPTHVSHMSGGCFYARWASCLWTRASLGT